MYSVNEFFEGKWLGYWAVETEEEAREIIASLKVARRTKTFNIEHPDGYVVDVWKPVKDEKKN
jgi:hypothetical protein